MSARQTAQTRSPSPATAAPSSSQAFTAPAASNAARCEDLGLTGPVPPTATATLFDTLAALGPAADVVLDAMPESASVPLAVAHRATPWASAWLSALAPARLLLGGTTALARLLETVVRPGVGVEAAAHIATSLEHVGLAGDGGLRVVRTEQGFDVTVEGATAAGLGAGLGAEVTGARGAQLAGGAAGASVAAVQTVTLGWDLTCDEVAELLIETPAAAAAALCNDGVGVMAGLVGAVEAAVARRAPSRVRVGWAASAKASGAVSMSGVAGAGLEGMVGAGVAVGCDAAEGRAYVEAGCTAELKAAVGIPAGQWALRALGGDLADLEWERAAGLRVRVSARLTASGPTDLAFEVERTARDTDGERADTVETSDPRALAAVLARMAGASVGATAGEVPDVALRRSRTAHVRDPERLRAFPELTWGAAAAVWSLPDAVVLEHTADVCAEVRVDADAVAAVCGSLDRVRAAEDPEAELLDLERAVASAALDEGSCLDADVDPAVAASVVDVEAVTEARLTLAAGLGGDLDALALQGGLTAEGAATAFVRTPSTLPVGGLEALTG